MIDIGTMMHMASLMYIGSIVGIDIMMGMFASWLTFAA